MSIQIQGTLLNPSGGNPAAGAQIRFISLAGWGGVSKGAESIEITGSDGSYDFPLQQGRYAVAINQNGVFAKQGSAVVNDDTPSPLTIDELMKFSEPLTPSEIKYVEELVAQAELARDKSQQYANEASQSVVDASYEVAKAAQQVGYAEDQVDLAKAEVVNASNEADRAKSEADRASEVAGLDTVEQAVDMALAEFAGVMTASEHDAILAQNEEKYAASGMVHMGKHRLKPSGAGVPINEGMWAYEIVSDKLHLGVGDNLSGEVGTSKTKYPVTHIAGVVSNILHVNETNQDRGNEILLPPAPNGTVTYNKTTGENITHPDAATAFALADTDVNIEVSTDCVDVFGFEQIVIKGDEVFDMVQSQSTTFGNTDVPTVVSTKSDSFFAAYEGQVGVAKGRCVKWSTLTDTQKRKVAAYLKERLAINENGELENISIVQDSKRGLGNGDWFNINPVNGALEFKSGLPVLSRNGHPFVKDENRQGVFTDNNGSYYYVLGTVSRLNTGAFAKGVNEPGGMAFSDGNKWSSTVDSYATQLECFQNAHATLSGRDDGRLPQYIYEGGLGGVVDRRLSAYAMSSPEESAKAWEKVKNGTYRGLEKLVWTTPIDDSSFDDATYKIRDVGTTWTVYGSFAANYAVGAVLSIYNPTAGEVISGEISSVSNTFLQIEKSTATGSMTEVTVASGNPAYCLVTTELNTSVSGNFTMTDVIGDPANILLTDALKDGWQGSWIPVIPDGTGLDFPLTRKSVVSGASGVSSKDTGGSWSTLSLVLDTTKNVWTPVTFREVGEVSIINYTAFAKQTKPSTNKPVLNGESGLMDVVALSNNTADWGSIFAESLIGKVLTSSNDPRNNGLSVLSKVIRSDNGQLLSNSAPTHTALSLGTPNNNSPAVKALPYQISDNGQCSIGVQANELTYVNLSGTDKSGSDTTLNTVGEIYYVTSGRFIGEYLWCVQSYSQPLDNKNWFDDGSGGIRYNDAGKQVFWKIVNNLWGDDSTMKITADGSDTFVDLNGNTNLSVAHELALPIGWTHNHARVSTQVEGVDL